MSLINLTQMTNAIADACVPIICLLITAGGAYLLALLRKKTAILQQSLDNDMAGKYIEMAYDAVDQAVTFVAQTFVDALKSENAFTKERQLEAFYMAKDKVLSILGDTTVRYLNALYGDFEIWLETRIEQVCREIKQPETASALPGIMLIEAHAGQEPEEAGQEPEEAGQNPEEVGQEPEEVGQEPEEASEVENPDEDYVF